jgi:uncharacterized protein YraI
MKHAHWSLALPLLLLAPLAAFASDGWVTGDASLYTGPDNDYPRITVLEQGTRVEVLGCIDRWDWCDVVAYGERGWVDGHAVQLEYQGRRVYVAEYGPSIGIPIVAFSLGAYWGAHYHDRPWYEHRDSWAKSSHGSRPNYTYSISTSRNTGKATTSETRVRATTAPAQTSTQTATQTSVERTRSSGQVSAQRTETQPVTTERTRSAEQVNAQRTESKPGSAAPAPARETERTTVKTDERATSQPAHEQTRVARQNQPASSPPEKSTKEQNRPQESKDQGKGKEKQKGKDNKDDNNDPH